MLEPSKTKISTIVREACDSTTSTPFFGEDPRVLVLVLVLIIVVILFLSSFMLTSWKSSPRSRMSSLFLKIFIDCSGPLNFAIIVFSGQLISSLCKKEGCASFFHRGTVTTISSSIEQGGELMTGQVFFESSRSMDLISLMPRLPWFA